MVRNDGFSVLCFFTINTFSQLCSPGTHAVRRTLFFVTNRTSRREVELNSRRSLCSQHEVPQRSFVTKRKTYPLHGKVSQLEVPVHGKHQLTNSDIEWRLRPPKDSPLVEKLMEKLTANIIRVECAIKGQTLPTLRCPMGGKAVLEAHVKSETGKVTQVGRFGITTQGGPSSPEIIDTIREIYNVEAPPTVGVGAIIYMFVDPEYRGSGIGRVSLEIISAIHSVQGCSFTILVADDDGSGKLVEWYQSNGFSLAPKLQNMMGSPEGQYGISMIAPVSLNPNFFDTCEIKWW